MNRAFLPFRFLPSRAVVDLLGNDMHAAAVLALEAVIKNRKSLEVAHQQIVVGDRHIAVSTRITAAGDLIVDLDIGDPNLSGRLILEEDLRRAMQSARVAAGLSRQRRQR